jgi:hypothetical protein
VSTGNKPVVQVQVTDPGGLIRGSRERQRLYQEQSRLVREQELCIWHIVDVIGRFSDSPSATLDEVAPLMSEEEVDDLDRTLQRLDSLRRLDSAAEAGIHLVRS